MAKRYSQLSVRLEEDLRAAIDLEAAREERTLASMIRVALRARFCSGVRRPREGAAA